MSSDDDTLVRGTEQVEPSGAETTGSAVADSTGGAPAIPEDNAAQAWSASNCEIARNCGCSPSDAECWDLFGESWAELISEGQAAGLEYDAACMNLRIQSIRTYGCYSINDMTTPELVEAGLLSTCRLFHGSRAVGEACSSLQDLFGDSCRQGARCVSERCVVDAPASAGEECLPGLPHRCVGELRCQGPEGQETCGEPEPTQSSDRVGDPCDPAFDSCGAYYCSPQGVCTEPPDLGEACRFQLDCQRGLSCDANVCVPGIPVACWPFG